MSKNLQFINFTIKSNAKFLKKLLTVHHKKEKNLKILFLFSYIAFVIIVISLDSTEKVTD